MSYQMSLFDGQQPLTVNKPIRLIELFAGIGSQAKALTNLGVEFEHYRICEFDKYAVKSYNAIHGTDFKTSDITQITADDLGIVDTDKYCYIMTYSFPCTDLSKAGQGKGMAKGSGTRSGLLWEVERLLTECKELPQILLMENVPDVIGTKNVKHFADWIAFLDELGYESRWEVLNAKDYGIPQNRERCFAISWLKSMGDCYYAFPPKIQLKDCLANILQYTVLSKYYLSSKTIKMFVKMTQKHIAKGNNFKFNPSNGKGVAKAITTREGCRTDDNFIKCEEVGMLSGGKWDKLHDISRRVYSPNGLAPTLHTMGGGQQELKIVEAIAYDEQNGYLRQDGCVGTLTTDGSTPKHNNRIVYPNDRIRKLTPRECWRLMGFDNIDFDNTCYGGISTLEYRTQWNDRTMTKTEWKYFYRLTRTQKMSNSQLYKQAGNSIVVTVLMAIFGRLLNVDYETKINELVDKLKNN